MQGLYILALLLSPSSGTMEIMATQPMATKCYCARCKYKFDGSVPFECPLCGTQDVEPAAVYYPCGICGKKSCKCDPGDEAFDET